MKILSIISCLAIALTGFADADKPKKKKYLNSPHPKELEVTYKTINGKDLKLDIYYPPTSDSKSPVVFYTHGGGWAQGSKHNISNKGATFLPIVEAGFSVVSITYRLTNKEKTVGMRDCVTDCKDAVRFIAQNSEQYNVDPERFYVMGDSAGGQIAQVLLLSSPESFPGDKNLKDVSYNMVAGLSWYGPSSFEDVNLFNHDDRPNFKDRFGGRILKATDKPEDKDKLYAEMSAYHYLRKDSPPLLLIQGDMDTTIPVKHAYLMQEKADEIGAPVTSIIVKGAGHNWREAQKGTKISPSRQEVFTQTAQFFIDHK